MTKYNHLSYQCLATLSLNCECHFCFKASLKKIKFHDIVEVNQKGKKNSFHVQKLFTFTYIQISMFVIQRMSTFYVAHSRVKTAWLKAEMTECKWPLEPPKSFVLIQKLKPLSKIEGWIILICHQSWCKRNHSCPELT